MRAAAPARSLSEAELRATLLAAAARIYAMHGSIGTTGERVAKEAGVAEAALVRRFGSTHALLRAAVAERTASEGLPALPQVPDEPERALAAWCAGTFAWVHDRRDVLRRMLAELDEQPALGEYAVETLRRAVAELGGYFARVMAGAPAGASAARWTAAQGLARIVFTHALEADAASIPSFATLAREALTGLRPLPARRRATEPVSSIEAPRPAA